MATDKGENCSRGGAGIVTDACTVSRAVSEAQMSDYGFSCSEPTSEANMYVSTLLHFGGCPVFSDMVHRSQQCMLGVGRGP